MKYKLVTSFMTVGILSLLVGGFTMAYFKDEIRDYELATFSTAKVKIAVNEGKNKSQSPSEFLENRNVEWEIENKGTESIRLKTRVKESGRDEEVVLTSSDGWVQGKDGYYYYDKVVEPEAIVVFPLAISFDTWDVVTDYGINIEAEAIQASNNAIDYMWLENSYEE